jgi:uncharacterized protein YdhG (YjbR/CyaY superfamily)
MKGSEIPFNTEIDTMAKSKVSTVEEYLAGLSEERRAVLAAVLEVIRKNLPEGYSEGINWGMIAFEVPLERYPSTYNKQPLSYVCLAAQKNHFSLYLSCIDAGSNREKRLREAFQHSGKKLDMGKSCIRFKKLDDLDLDVIGRLIAEMPVDECIARYEAGRKKS